MKTRSFIYTVLFSLFTLVALPVSAETNPGNEEATVKKMTKEEYNEAVDALKERVEILKEAKKNAKSKEEKKKVKEEIKDVKKEVKYLEQQQNGGFGIYIGGGALIVILLLILLL